LPLSTGREGRRTACWPRGESKNINKNIRMSDYSTMVKRTRELRRNMTKAEKVLWEKLRNRKLSGLKFLRQHPFIYQVVANRPYYFIADFYCAEKSLIIEVDGKIHDFQIEEDQHREEILNSLELKVLRIKNEEVEDMDKVIEKIKTCINQQ
jgi:leucyl-tRNA synthetase